MGTLGVERDCKGRFVKTPHYFHKTKKPWYSIYRGIKSRCNNSNNPFYKYYGGRGIVVDITFWEVGFIYNRDNADMMKDPTIDRIDNGGNYTFDNCQFIERIDNVIKELIGRPCSQETRDKIAEGNRGKIVSIQTRKKLSDFNKGKVLSLEHRAKMSLSQKRRWGCNFGNA